MRRTFHAMLVAAAQLPLLVAFGFFGVFALLAVAADHALPHARFGNCWTYAAARWARRGGYITFRRADGIAFLGRVPIPHALWQPSLNAVRMTYPLQRRAGNMIPWWALLFRFAVWHGDRPQPNAWAETSLPEAWQDTGPPRG